MQGQNIRTLSLNNYMRTIKALNIFYQEPDPDRWIKYDRYPRRWIRRFLRGKPKPGGVMMVAIELMKGLKKLNIPYRFNDFNYIDDHPEEIACIIGKPQLLFNRKWKNPILFGAGVYSHPTDCPKLFEVYPNVKKFLVPGNWMKEMCCPYYGDKVEAWPVGIDTAKWTNKNKRQNLIVDFLIYDKIRWELDESERDLLQVIINELKSKNLKYHIIKYGGYKHQDLVNELNISKAAIFLCEHETQGMAYQQILATNTPIIAWDRAGYWKDPSYYPEIKYAPVSSVPYWDYRCGLKFKSPSTFAYVLEEFLTKYEEGAFFPREYIRENLSLEICTIKYVDIYKDVLSALP